MGGELTHYVCSAKTKTPYGVDSPALYLRLRWVSLGSIPALPFNSSAVDLGQVPNLLEPWVPQE